MPACPLQTHAHTTKQAQPRVTGQANQVLTLVLPPLRQTLGPGPWAPPLAQCLSTCSGQSAEKPCVGQGDTGQQHQALCLHPIALSTQE